jgi:hypothetical protein
MERLGSAIVAGLISNNTLIATCLFPDDDGSLIESRLFVSFFGDSLLAPCHGAMCNMQGAHPWPEKDTMS